MFMTSRGIMTVEVHYVQHLRYTGELYDPLPSNYRMLGNALAADLVIKRSLRY